MLAIEDWTVRRGERWILRGCSGAGKSTLLRALAGLWPDGHGRIAMPADGRVMFVPQKLYMPMGSLKNAICFPDEASRHEDGTIVEWLAICGLAGKAPAMNEIRAWTDELSPGEQQRVALARILLHRPDYLLLDEATSALDPQNAAEYYVLLSTWLPDLTLVSVVHADALEAFHTHALCLVDGASGEGCAGLTMQCDLEIRNG